MHEFSLAQGLHGQLLDLAREHEMGAIREAEVCVGRNSSIVLESFTFGFGVVAEQNPITQGMRLTITHDDGSDLVLMRVELE